MSAVPLDARTSRAGANVWRARHQGSVLPPTSLYSADETSPRLLIAVRTESRARRRVVTFDGQRPGGIAPARSALDVSHLNQEPEIVVQQRPIIPCGRERLR